MAPIAGALLLMLLAVRVGAQNVATKAARGGNHSAGGDDTEESAAASPSRAESVAAVASQAGARTEDGPPILSFFKSTELSGFVDAYYAYNFNRPERPCALVGNVAIVNCLHNFDVAHNSFNVSLVQLALEKKTTSESRAGFRLDVDYGPATTLLADDEPRGSRVSENVHQAYVSYRAPLSKGDLDIDFGKFATPVGNEVFETKNNWNYSRSLLFALAIPHYHMGVRATYRPTDTFAVTTFLSNGWNHVVDNNSAKSVGISMSARLGDRLTVRQTYLGGPEADDDPGGWRHFSDTVAVFQWREHTQLAVNYDIGTDHSTGQRWQGVAAYLRYQPSDRFAIVPRFERLLDGDGFMTGASQNLQELTLTADFKPSNATVMRVEYRTDVTGRPFFLKNASETVSYQGVLTFGLVYSFSSKAASP